MGVRFHEVEARSALNRVPGDSLPFNWTVNPYRGCTHACTYCFARPTHRYLDLNAREDFEREIVVKVNVPERLRAELKRPSWKGETVALGTNTDPYQWVEGRYGLTRAIWEVLIEARNSGSVLTKSPLLLRDIDLFKELARGRRLPGEPLDPDARRDGLAGERAANAASAQADRGGGRAERGRDPRRGADRAADAGHQRLARAGRGDPAALRRGGRERASAGSACT